MVVGSAMLVVVHLTFALTSLNPLDPHVLTWHDILSGPGGHVARHCRIVGDNRLGSAYGFTFSIQNIGLFLFPILIGMVLERYEPRRGHRPGCRRPAGGGSEHCCGNPRRAGEGLV